MQFKFEIIDHRILRGLMGIIALAACTLTAGVAVAQENREYPGAPVTYEQPVPQDMHPRGAVPTNSPGTASHSPANAARQRPPADPPLRLRNPADASEQTASSESTWFGAFLSMIGSLSIVLALFLAIAWFTKRQLPSAGSELPREVLDVLGRAPLGPRQHVHLVQLGQRLLLVAVSPNGAQTLAEVSDPQEIERLVDLCAATTAPRNVRGLIDLIRRPKHVPLEVGDV